MLGNIQPWESWLRPNQSQFSLRRRWKMGITITASKLELALRGQIEAYQEKEELE